ncbi:MAG: amidohydrolase [Rickettsiales bacterium]|nr:amidohydrolase [Rickettsiales bacterium]
MKILIKNVSCENGVCDILVQDNKISKIASNIDVNANLEIDGKDKAILPAFYNTHCHAGMVLLRGHGDDKELFSWLNEDIWPAEAKLKEEDIYFSSKFAILEMIKSGTVFFSDMYFHQKSTMQAITEMGIRAAISTVEFDLFDKETAEQKKLETMEFVNLKNPCPDRIIKAISCHAIYTVSEELFRFAANTAKKNNMFLHIHACETQKEVDDCFDRYDMTPIEKLEEMGCLTDKTILAHCVHLNDKDIELIKKYNVKISHCPISNLKLNSGKMALQELLDEKCFVTLGTDGASSNNNLSMFDEMKVSALSAKNQANLVTAGKVSDIFKIATENGARAFDLNAGKIEEGKLADFILVDLNNVQLLPNHNLISNLVYSADNSCITDVFCDGKPLMLNKKIKGEKEIIKNFKNAHAKL